MKIEQFEDAKRLVESWQLLDRLSKVDKITLKEESPQHCFAAWTVSKTPNRVEGGDRAFNFLNDVDLAMAAEIVPILERARDRVGLRLLAMGIDTSAN